MRHRIIGTVAVGIMALVQTWTCANAAALPPPGKLCKLIAASADEGNTDSAPKWTAAKSGGFYCSTTGVLTGGVGSTYMSEYDATGPTKTTPTTVYFKIQIWDIPMKKDVVATPILSRLSAVFAASGGGPLPDDLSQAVNAVTSTTVQTTLGVARTRFTPADNTDQPDNGATFEVQVGGQ